MLKYAIIICVVFLIGCGKTAKIGMMDGRQFTGQIIGGDNESINVATFGGSIKKIPKDSIGDIDHPGNGLAVTGGCLTGYFIFNYLVGLSAISAAEEDCENDPYTTCSFDSTPIHLVNIVGLIAGVSMFGYGFSNWKNSVKHVRGPNIRMTLDKDGFGAIYTYNF